MILKFPSRHDANGFKELMAFYNNFVVPDSELLLDMSEVNSFTSSAISLIVKIYKKCDDNKIIFRLINLSRNIYIAFVNLNLHKFFEMSANPENH
jgi:anti-anti-sigma factor